MSGSLRPWPASEDDPAPCRACDPDLDPSPWVPESSSRLLVSPVRDFLVLPGSCWRDTQCRFCVFCFIPLNIISIISVINKAGLIFNL